MNLLPRTVASFLRGWRCAAVAFVLASASLCPAFAQSAEPAAVRSSQATGAVSGRVQNVVTGQYLNNARVAVKGTDIAAFTDEAGSFRLSGVPAGPVTLEVFYTGLDPQQETLQVSPGQVVERNFELTNKSTYGEQGGVVKLDPFVASSSKLTEGEALATNEQRFASNIKNVVAADAFGDVTEGNVAEFMKFLPGVTIDYSDASPNAVAVRGFDPNMTGVTMDGSSLANASGSAADRAFLFTQVSVNNMSRVEVTKVPTPANPADGISGSVNMVSKSAFERSKAQFNYRVFLSASSDGMQIKKQPFPFDNKIYRIKPGFDFDYTLPITKNFGIVVTGLHSKQWNEQNISGMTWNATAANTGASPSRPFLQQHQITDAPKWYTRDSTSLKADWRVTPNSVLSFGAQANYYVDKNGNVSRTATTGTNPAPTPATGSTRLSYDENTTIGATGRGGVTFGGNFLHIGARTLATNTRYRFDNGDWRFDTGAHVSTSKTWRRHDEKGTFRAVSIAMAQPVRVTFEGITPVRPAAIRVFDNNDRELDINDINNYRLNSVSSNDHRDHKENVRGGDMNVKRRLSIFDVPAAVQIGGLYRAQDRSRRSSNRAWTYNPPDGNFSPEPFLAQVYKNRPNYFGFDHIPWTATSIMVEEWRKNPNLFIQTPAQMVATEQSRIVGSEWLRESVTALYAQTEARLFRNRLSVLTGVRYEKTHDKGAGPLNEPSAVWQRNPDGTFARNAAGQRIRRPEAGAVGSMDELRLVRQERANFGNRSYDGYYPSIHLTFNATEKFLLRAAYAKTYGRPNFPNIVPNAEITENDVDLSSDPNALPGIISIRNTGLKPWTAQNYDLSAEYYTDNGGLITAGVFRKDITDFFGTLQTIATEDILNDFGLDPRYAGWRLNSTINSGDARVTGVEFNVRQTLGRFGNWGRNLSVFANATKLRLEGSRTADFNRFIPKSANWGFTYTRRPITFMAKWHHRGEQNRGPATAQGPLAIQYMDPRTTLDVNVTYQAFKRLSVFVNARNLLNEWHTQSRYQEDTPEYARRSSTNSYGVQWALGVKGTF